MPGFDIEVSNNEELTPLERALAFGGRAAFGRGAESSSISSVRRVQRAKETETAMARYRATDVERALG